MDATILFRRDITPGVNQNRVLLKGEPGAEFDVSGALIKLAVGDGVTAWSALPNILVPPVEITEVRHDWAEHGWSVFTPVTISADGSQAFSTTVVNGRGHIAGTQVAGGAHRVAYLRDDTSWADSEITSLVVGPSATFAANAQQGHLHRVREVSPGVWEAIAAWTAVVGGGYETINTRGVRFDGVTLSQSTGDPAFTSDILYFRRDLAIVTKERVTAFGLFFNNLVCVPSHLFGMVSGDVVTVDSIDSTFDAASQGVAGTDPMTANVQLQETTTLSTSALALDRGTVQFSGASVHKRQLPYWMSTRVRGGTASAAVIEVKRWRPEDPEPDWGDARVVRANVTSGGSVPSLALGPGRCGLWGAHFVSGGPAGVYGPVRFREAS